MRPQIAAVCLQSRETDLDEASQWQKIERGERLKEGREESTKCDSKKGSPPNGAGRREEGLPPSRRRRRKRAHTAAR